MARTVVTQLVLNAAGYLGPLKAAAAGTRDFGNEFDKAARSGAKGFDKLAQGSAIAGAAVLAGFAVAVAASAKFDKQMSSVSAAASATGKDLGALREAALQAGAATAFSATEAARAEEELAKAGVSVKDILGGGLQGALDLAAAGQLEVGDAAEIAATAMTQFRLSGSKVPHIADLLSAAANKAQGSVQDVGMALKQGGLVASQFGLSIEETTGGIAAFASAGLIGSDAGTSLKTMLLALANPTDESAALMRKLGISAYDAKGNFVGLAGLAGQLRAQMSGLTQAERDQALAQIFGNDAVRAANVLYRNGADGINKWTSEVDDAGNATRTAATKMDNLSGDLEKLKGSLETALIQTGSSANGVLRALTQTANNMVDSFAALPGPVQGTVTVIALASGVALTAAGAYGTLAPKVREARNALVEMGPAGARANDLLGKLGKTAGYAAIAVVGLEVVAAVSNKIYESSGKATPKVEELTVALREYAQTGKVAGAAATVMGKDFTRAGADLAYAVGEPSDAIVGFMRTWSNFSEQVLGTVGFENIAGDFDDVNRRIKATDQSLAALVSAGNGKAAEDMFKRIAEKAALKGVSIDVVKKKFPEYVAAVKAAQVSTMEAGNSLETAAGQTRTLGRSLADAVREAGSLEDALKGLNDVNVGAAESNIAFQLSVNGLTKELKDNGNAWAGNSDAALKNRKAVIDRITAGQELLGKQYEATKAAKGEAAANAEASASYAVIRGKIIDAAVAAGRNRAEVTALVDQLFRVPKDTPARVSTPGAVRAKTEVETLRGRLGELKDKSVKLSQQGGPGVERQLQRLAAEQDEIERQIDIRIQATYSVRGTRPSGLPHNPLGSNLDRSRWGNVYSYAGGGIQAKIAGPGTIYQWAEPETGGEAFIPKHGDAARSKAILSEAASWYGGAVSYGGGAQWAGAMHAGSGGGGASTTVVNLTAHFSGPVGSRIELENWLVKGIERVRTAGRF